MGNDLNNAMDSTEGNNQYDEAAKRILGNKEVLSHILTNTVDEYKKMKPEDVIPLIESDPYISIVPVEPGLTNAEKTVNGERIVGFNTENSERYEGLIRFDVIKYTGENPVACLWDEAKIKKRRKSRFLIYEKFSCTDISYL